MVLEEWQEWRMDSVGTTLGMFSRRFLVKLLLEYVMGEADWEGVDFPH